LIWASFYALSLAGLSDVVFMLESSSSKLATSITMTGIRIVVEDLVPDLENNDSLRDVGEESTLA